MSTSWYGRQTNESLQYVGRPVVFAAGWPVTMVGLDVCDQTRLTRKQLDLLAREHGPLGHFVISIAEYLLKKTEESGKAGTAISPQEDVRELSEALLARGAQNVAVKLGARGSYLATGDGIRTTVSAFAVKAIDSTAAGDGYNAALAVGILTGLPPIEAARYASAAAAISVTRPGAQPSWATGEEVRQFLGAIRFVDKTSYSNC